MNLEKYIKLNLFQILFIKTYLKMKKEKKFLHKIKNFQEKWRREKMKEK
jgi:hypothetical protein